MAFAFFDRVKETSATTGTGAISLAGAVSGFNAFSSVYANGDTFYYCIADAVGNNWEIGLGTYTSSGNHLTRTAVLASSNTGSLVNFTSGALLCFVTLAAAQFAYNGNGVVNGNYAQSIEVAASGQSAITTASALTCALAGGGAGNLSAGAYKYITTFISPTGETAPGTASNSTTVVTPASNGKMALTSIPVSGNGTVTARNIYRTPAGGSQYYFLHQIADNTTTTYTDNIGDVLLTYGIGTGQSQIPNYVSYGAVASAAGGDTSTGVKYLAEGTTTTGEQFNFNTKQGGILTTGKHQFYCANVLAFEVTDTLWNPNAIYQGAPTAWLVASSGALAGGPDNIAVLGVNGSTYDGITVTGLTIMAMPRGATGEWHFSNNGMIGHVTIAAPSNPNGNDAYYGTANGLTLYGSASGVDAVIATTGNGNGGMSFYNIGNKGFTFSAGNGTSSICSLDYVASAVNSLRLAGGASGVNPILYTQGGAGSIRLTLAGTDTAGVDICNGGQYNGTAACAPIAKFNGVFESTNFFTFTAGTVATIGTNGGDLLLTGGSGFIAFGTYTNTPATSAGYITIHDAGGTARKLMVGT